MPIPFAIAASAASFRALVFFQFSIISGRALAAASMSAAREASKRVMSAIWAAVECCPAASNLAMPSSSPSACNLKVLSKDLEF